ncbi:MAG: radical SAM protein [bacterium]|nr:radical SAM protein [bacterium]
MAIINILEIAITSHCNFRCKHCYITDFNLDIPFIKIVDIFDEFTRLKGLYIRLTGGEPFLYPDFLKIVSEARKRGLYVTVYSNGSLITNSIVKELKKLSVLSYVLSFYGASASTYEAVTGVADGYVCAIKSLETLFENNCHVTVNIPITNNNVQDMDKMVQILSRFPLTNVNFNPLMFNRHDGSRPPAACSLEPSKIIELLKMGYPSNRFIAHERRHNPKGLNCYHAIHGCYIAVNGDVYPCQFFPLSAGNIYNESFDEIWNNSDVLLKIRNATPKDFVDCYGCKFFWKCRRCCSVAYFTHGNMFRRPDFTCKIVKGYYGER